MRIGARCVGLIALLAPACRPSPLELDIERPPGVRSMLVLIESQSGSKAIAIGEHNEGAEALPHFPASARSQRMTVTRLDYQDTLDELWLTPGEVTVPEGAPRRPIFFGVSAARATTEGDHVSPFVPLERESFSSDLTLPCPSFGADAFTHAIDLPAGCSLSGPPRVLECYSPLVYSDTLNDLTYHDPKHSLGSLTVERGRSTMYLTTSLWRGPAGDDFTRPARMQMVDSDRADPSSLTDLDVVPPPGVAVGWLDAPRVRSDGLEMFLAASYPDARWWNNRLFESHRASVDAPSSTILPLDTLSYLDMSSDCTPAGCAADFHNPVLLPDYRTLIYSGFNRKKVLVARRKTTEPGDRAFDAIGEVALDVSNNTFEHLQLSCDGDYLLYSRDVSSPGESLIFEPRVAPIVTFDPLQFGQVQPLRADPRTSSTAHPFGMAQGHMTLVESADCKTLFVSVDRGIYLSHRVPCP